MEGIIIASAVRTPIGAFGGVLEGLTEQQLGAAVMAEAVRRAGILPEKIDEVIAGVARQTSTPSNAGRHALLLARLPEQIPAYTVQLQGASGLQAILCGFRAIWSGEATVVMAGGMESTSRIPFEIRDARYDFSEPRRRIVDAIPAQETGAQPSEVYGLLTAERVAFLIASRHRLSEGELAAHAAESFKKSVLAVKEGRLRREIFPVRAGGGQVQEDELSQPALLSAPADGAAMCLLAERRAAEALGLPCLAQIVGAGAAAADPRRREEAVAAACRIALGQAGLALGELDHVELHEGSAAEYAAVLRLWEAQGMSREVLSRMVNPSGGALAFGDTWGAAGAVLMVRLVHELHQRRLQMGLAAMAASGGQALAVVVRRGSP